MTLALSLLLACPSTNDTAVADTASSDTAADSGGDSAALPDGQTLYLDNCSRCHGEDAGGVRGQGPAINAEIDKLSDEQIIDIILNGKGRDEMPAIDVTEAEAQLIVDYMRENF